MTITGIPSSARFVLRDGLYYVRSIMLMTKLTKRWTDKDDRVRAMLLELETADNEFKVILAGMGTDLYMGKVSIHTDIVVFAAESKIPILKALMYKGGKIELYIFDSTNVYKNLEPHPKYPNISYFDFSLGEIWNPKKNKKDEIKEVVAKSSVRIKKKRIKKGTLEYFWKKK